MLELYLILHSQISSVPVSFFKICSWHYSQIFQEAKYPHHLLSYFAGQGIKKILDGAFPIYCLIKNDGSVHGNMLTRTLTSVKLIVNFGNMIEIFHADVPFLIFTAPKTSMFMLFMLNNPIFHAWCPSIGSLRNRWSCRGRPAWFLIPGASR